VPFSGQGAEQAILDAICLVNLLYKLDRNSLPDITKAFQDYYDQRHHVLKTAFNVSSYMSSLMDSHGLTGELKRTMTFNMPAWVTNSSTDKIQVRPLLGFLPAVDDRGSKSVSTKSV
jgi:2-polyprenyl-6-methoxyphenol hydroxylase-like FAD-dependent oxidoreductase